MPADRQPASAVRRARLRARCGTRLLVSGAASAAQRAWLTAHTPLLAPAGVELVGVAPEPQAGAWLELELETIQRELGLGPDRLARRLWIGPDGSALREALAPAPERLVVLEPGDGGGAALAAALQAGLPWVLHLPQRTLHRPGTAPRALLAVSSPAEARLALRLHEVLTAGWELLLLSAPVVNHESAVAALGDIGRLDRAAREAAGQLRQAGFPVRTLLVPDARPETLLEQAALLEASLIVVPAGPPPGRLARALGHLSRPLARLAARAHRPLLLWRDA